MSQLRTLPLNVAMLGGFYLAYDDNEARDSDFKSPKVCTLLQYLIINRRNEVSQFKLIELLYGDEESENPAVALKNLIYRARYLLKKLLGVRDDYIIFEGGTYKWNNELPCTVDTERFESCIQRASNPDLSDNERYFEYSAAISLYRGDFLSQCAYDNWVLPKAAYYSNLYVKCVLCACAILKSRGEYSEMALICENALAFAPFEDKIHELLMIAYLAQEQYSRALGHYSHMTALFYDELGIAVPESIRKIYSKIVDHMNRVEPDIANIESDLRETAMSAGAFFCEYEVFKNIYKIEAREIGRVHRNIYLMLITAEKQNGGIFASADGRAAMDALKQTIISNLRKSDVVARYSPTQFVCLLQMNSEADGDIIAERIVNDYNRDYRRYDVHMISRISKINAVDEPLDDENKN